MKGANSLRESFETFRTLEPNLATLLDRRKDRESNLATGRADKPKRWSFRMAAEFPSDPVTVASRDLRDEGKRPSAKSARHKEQPKGEDSGEPPAKLAFLPYIKGQSVPAREWIVPDWVPRRKLTLPQGNGGLGKSALVQQLAIGARDGARLNWPASQGMRLGLDSTARMTTLTCWSARRASMSPTIRTVARPA